MINCEANRQTNRGLELLEVANGRQVKNGETNGTVKVIFDKVCLYRHSPVHLFPVVRAIVLFLVQKRHLYKGKFTSPL